MSSLTPDVHARYAARLSIPLSGDSTTRFLTRSGELLATGYMRVVIGARGPYVELAAGHLNLVVLREAPDPHRYYVELRSVADDVKVYAQLLPAGYADYVPGMFYVSPFELFDVSGQVLISPLRVRDVPGGPSVVG